MSCGICGRCQLRASCRLRQPGTWIVQCDQYVRQGTKTPSDRSRRESRPEKSDH